MKKFLYILFSSVTMVVITAISPLSHVSAMQTHGTSTNMSQHCAILCNNETAKKEDTPGDLDRSDEDDDTPIPPYYLQFQSAQTGFQVEKAIQARDIDVPTNIPLYRLFQVIRR